MWIISLFFAMILVGLLQMLFFSRNSLKSLTYRRYFTPGVANPGDEVTMVEVIRNEKLLPIPWIRIEAGLAPGLIIGNETESAKSGRHFQRSIFSLKPYTTVTRRHSVRCPRRGYYAINSVAVTAGDLLGMGKQRSVELPTDSLVVVYPELIPIEDIFQEKNSFSGDLVVRRWIMDDPFMIRGVRAYTGAEPYNRINWKATAKTGEMQVHEYDFTSDIRLMVVVNVDMSDLQWTVVVDEDGAERAFSLAASIAQYALENGVETGFATNAQMNEDTETMVMLEPQSGGGQMTALLETVARLSYKRTRSFSALLGDIAAMGRGNLDILLITAYTDQATDRAIDALRANGGYVELLSPKEFVEENAV